MIKGGDYLQEQYISLSDLRKVSGIGDKTIERIKEQLLQNEIDNNYKSEYNANIKLDINNIYQGDCLELMNGIPDKSIDMILCDLPYGTTACKWDSIIPFEPLWKQYERIIKDNGAIVLTGSQPFTTDLINSNRKIFKYEWIWEKTKGGAFANANRMPMKRHENVLVFYKKQPTYNPQKTKAPEHLIDKRKTINNSRSVKNYTYTGLRPIRKKDDGTRFPTSVIHVNSETGLHPTQKPVALFEYLIKTYTNEGETVLDNCIGSGTTAIACINTNRNYIGIELDEEYYNIAKNRINEHKSQIT